MKKSEKTLAIVVGLMLIIWGLLFLARKKPEPVKVPEASKRREVEVLEDTQLFKKIFSENIPDDTALSKTRDLVCDPFVKLELKKKKAPDISKLTLEGIIWSEKPPRLAVINDINVTEGDTISGFKVEEIQKDKVILSQEGNKYIIKLRSNKSDNEE